MHRSRGDDLGVAIGGEIAQPEALLAAVTDYVEDVSAVGRDGGARGLAGFGDFADGDALEGEAPAAVEKSINAVASSGEHSEDHERGESEAQLVLACGGHDCTRGTDG